MSARLQLPALLFLVSVVTGVYFLRSQRRAKEDFRRYLRDVRVGGWGEAAVFDKELKDKVGEIETVSLGRSAGTPDPARSFTTRSAPPEFASRFLDVPTWQAVCAVAALEDPLHQFYLSGNGVNVTVSLVGRAIALTPQP